MPLDTSTDVLSARTKSSRGLWAGLIGSAFLSLVLLAYPLYVIRPFRHQNAGELALALAVVHYRLFAQVTLLAISLGLLFLAWRRTARIWPRAVGAVLALLVFGFGLLSQVNIFELMFHPLGQLSFSSPSKARLGKDEEVIAVRVRGEARAYPIRSMSYHHIVNDRIAGLPIVATY